MSQTDRTLHQALMTKVGRTLGKGVFAALGWLPALLPAKVWVPAKVGGWARWRFPALSFPAAEPGGSAAELYE